MHLIPANINFQSSVPSLKGKDKDKEMFIHFARKVLQWLSEDRKTAKELLDDPWLKWPASQK